MKGRQKVVLGMRYKVRRTCNKMVSGDESMIKYGLVAQRMEYLFHLMCSSELLLSLIFLDSVKSLCFINLSQIGSTGYKVVGMMSFTRIIALPHLISLSLFSTYKPHLFDDKDSDYFLPPSCLHLNVTRLRILVSMSFKIPGSLTATTDEVTGEALPQELQIAPEGSKLRRRGDRR